MLPIRSYQRREDLHYDVVGSLGYGGFGNVFEVKTKVQRFAMKVMHTQRSNRALLMETLRREVDIIYALQDHHHFVNVVEAYETKTEIGLVLSPVASSGSLAQCFDQYLENKGANFSLEITFDRAFGCLAEGLAWMHQQRIRHKDIKPANILVHKGEVLYCDFGCSLDSSESDNSTTEGPARTTRKYMAPEVKTSQSRNSTSDTYSLGCVFLEILYIIVLHMAVSVANFSDEMHNLRIHLQTCLQKSVGPVHFGPQSQKLVFLRLKSVQRMTDDEPRLRPSMEEIASSLCQSRELCCSVCTLIHRRLGNPKPPYWEDMLRSTSLNEEQTEAMSR